MLPELWYLWITVPPIRFRIPYECPPVPEVKGRTIAVRIRTFVERFAAFLIIIRNF